MNTISPRQLDVLRILHAGITANGYPPTMREIGEQLKLSGTQGIWSHLDRLEAKGFITKIPKASRTVRITQAGLELLRDA